LKGPDEISLLYFLFQALPPLLFALFSTGLGVGPCCSGRLTVAAGCWPHGGRLFGFQPIGTGVTSLWAAFCPHFLHMRTLGVAVLLKSRCEAGPRKLGQTRDTFEMLMVATPARRCRPWVRLPALRGDSLLDPRAHARQAQPYPCPGRRASTRPVLPAIRAREEP